VRRLPLIAAAGIAAVALTGTLIPSATAAPSPNAHGAKRVCSKTPRAGTASCHAEVRTKGGDVTPDATTTYASGYTPQQLQTAYAVPKTGATTRIAIVDAYANPNAQADLDAYRAQFGLGPKTLAQYNQDGGTTLPNGDVGWGQEEMLDLEMASAICPSCAIVYVGANSASFTDLMAAVKTAAGKGASVISNSYGGSEFRGEQNYAATYDIPGVINTISSGDSGYGVEFPAASGGQWTVAVGGTNLVLNADGSRKTETVWNGAGSGCSAYVSKPSWQKDTGCARRTVADVAAVADPATGVAVYDSYGSTGGANWFVFGGTSVAAPIVGAYYAAQGVPAGGVSSTYAARTSLFDVTSGSNGRCRNSVAYLCTGRSGYDGPTGAGTPKGTLG
jgi:subtilase family serine protease